MRRDVAFPHKGASLHRRGSLPLNTPRSFNVLFRFSKAMATLPISVHLWAAPHGHQQNSNQAFASGRNMDPYAPLIGGGLLKM